MPGPKLNGAAVRRAREAVELTQAQLAANLKVSEDTVSRWEHDGTIDPKKLPGLARQLKVKPPESLLAASAEPAGSQIITDPAHPKLESPDFLGRDDLLALSCRSFG